LQLGIIGLLGVRCVGGFRRQPGCPWPNRWPNRSTIERFFRPLFELGGSCSSRPQRPKTSLARRSAAPLSEAAGAGAVGGQAPVGCGALRSTASRCSWANSPATGVVSGLLEFVAANSMPAPSVVLEAVVIAENRVAAYRNGGGCRPLTQAVSGAVGLARNDAKTRCAQRDSGTTKWPMPGKLENVDAPSDYAAICPHRTAVTASNVQPTAGVGMVLVVTSRSSGGAAGHPMPGSRRSYRWTAEAGRRPRSGSAATRAAPRGAPRTPAQGHPLAACNPVTAP
jgi:hypothetical protein